MLVKSIVAGLAGTALLATVAVAQTPTDKGDKMSPAATSPAPAASTSATSPTEFKGNWRASKVAGLSVYNDKNESVGSINDLLMDKSGTIKAVVIGVGGFLGVGEHLVAVPLDKVKFVSEPIAYTGASNSTGGTAKTNTTTGAAPAAAASKPNPWYPDHAVFNASKDELKAMPEFKYSTD
ncbi:MULTISPECIES: PRC-barrel domain-containing protein [Bradyrhizobium]|jgi:sporulation protein YlmC with PRC-barrel domain|uniref:PRC-barrel domain-containing protein n=1 Tax=Bradyrhizobium TaxID=374 RepID=UPI00048A0967|nr:MULTISPECIES: PRC-barrel domain-containing protein [Bradyrhizobium]MCS3451754.1 sporulation protein YlmC with PRC-barrel domain [Bradyrhizobium elkanii]MCS3566147.1 sporulation protein YlmC with PRC-barrel domain [Bradyrhizobium elkanii]MCW2153123.1 sporulation protein YlmC with PRC-barrel domain [Bradyrhizobium elkanii]MCW2357138.1 sporulation protein YlmC with PRC-barrel domain [Bradyrhizobium elkanii]MCW2376856.1 sporulation protein YlmC with PRC-barrel domain [Bradyrhizobium elkanii]